MKIGLLQFPERLKFVISGKLSWMKKQFPEMPRFVISGKLPWMKKKFPENGNFRKMVISGDGKIGVQKIVFWYYGRSVKGGVNYR